MRGGWLFPLHVPPNPLGIRGGCMECRDPGWTLWKRWLDYRGCGWVRGSCGRLTGAVAGALW